MRHSKAEDKLITQRMKRFDEIVEELIADNFSEADAHEFALKRVLNEEKNR